MGFNKPTHTSINQLERVMERQRINQSIEGKETSRPAEAF